MKKPDTQRFGYDKEDIQFNPPSLSKPKPPKLKSKKEPFNKTEKEVKKSQVSKKSTIDKRQKQEIDANTHTRKHASVHTRKRASIHSKKEEESTHTRTDARTHARIEKELKDLISHKKYLSSFTFRFKPEELDELNEIVKKINHDNDLRISKNDIVRLSLNWLLKDYQENTNASVLARVLARI